MIWGVHHAGLMAATAVAAMVAVSHVICTEANAMKKLLALA